MQQFYARSLLTTLIQCECRRLSVFWIRSCVDSQFEEVHMATTDSDDRGYTCGNASWTIRAGLIGGHEPCGEDPFG